MVSRCACCDAVRITCPVAEALQLVRSRRRSGCCAPPLMRLHPPCYPPVSRRLLFLPGWGWRGVVYSLRYSISGGGGAVPGALPKALHRLRSSAHARAGANIPDDPPAAPPSVGSCALAVLWLRPMAGLPASHTVSRLEDRVLQPTTKYYVVIPTLSAPYTWFLAQGAERIDSVGLRSASSKYLRLAGHTVTITT